MISGHRRLARMRLVSSTPKYFGIVTGFATEDAEDHRVADVQINGTPVPMVFITPFDAATALPTILFFCPWHLG